MSRSFTNSARREQIVRAAIDVLADLGYAGATFARITERAGLSSPRMISYHFAGKDDLLRQVVEQVVSAGGRRIGDRVAEQSSAADRLRAYLESNLEFIREHPRELAALTEIGPHLRAGDGSRQDSVTAGEEHSVRTLADQLAEGQRTGEFREFDPRAMAVLIRSGVDAAAHRLRLEPDFGFDAYARELVTTYLRATAPD